MERTRLKRSKTEISQKFRIRYGKKMDLKLDLFYINDKRFLKVSTNRYYCILGWVDCISQETEKFHNETSKIIDKGMSTEVPRPNLKTKKILHAKQFEIL